MKILRRPKSRVPPPVKNAKSRSRKNAPKAFFPQFHIIFFRFLVNKMEDELDVMEEREWRRMEAKSFKEGFRQEIISYPKPRNAREKCSNYRFSINFVSFKVFRHWPYIFSNVKA